LRHGATGRALESIEPHKGAVHTGREQMRPTVDELMKRAFDDAIRDPRSAEYKAGVRSILSLHLGGVARPFPYRLGTTEADVYLAIASGARWRTTARFDHPAGKDRFRLKANGGGSMPV